MLNGIVIFFLQYIYFQFWSELTFRILWIHKTEVIYAERGNLSKIKGVCMHPDPFKNKSLTDLGVKECWTESLIFLQYFFSMWIHKTEVIYAERGDLSKCKDDLVTSSTRTLAILKSGAAAEIYIPFLIAGLRIRPSMKAGSEPLKQPWSDLIIHPLCIFFFRCSGWIRIR